MLKLLPSEAREQIERTIPSTITKLAKRTISGLLDSGLLKSDNAEGEKVVKTAMEFVTKDLLVELAELLSR